MANEKKNPVQMPIDVLKHMVPNLPGDYPDIGEVLLDTDTIDWRPKSLEGLYEKMLWRDPDSGASMALIKFEKGVGIPSPHAHASNQFMFVLSGKYTYTASNLTLVTGSFYWNPKGQVHGPTIAEEETIFFELYDGPHYPKQPDWYSDEQDSH